MIGAILSDRLTTYAFAAGACFGVVAFSLLLLALGAIERVHYRRRN